MAEIHALGVRLRQRDNLRFLTGRAGFTADLSRPGQAFAGFLRSPYPHARIRALDTAQAELMPNVVAVVTGGALAADTVRHIGEPVALVVAESREAARDAVERIAVDYEERPAVTSPGFTGEVGDKAATDDAFARAGHIIRLDIVTRRPAAALEPRATLAEYDPADDGCRLHTSARDHPSVEDTVLAEAARRLRRSIKWTAEHLEGGGDDDLNHAELALDRDGRFLGLRVSSAVNLGACLHPGDQPDPPSFGPYGIPAVHLQVAGAFTHTPPMKIGWPDVAYVVERLVDAAGRDLGIDRVEIRRRNLAPSIGAALDRAVARIDYAGLATRRAYSRALGKLHGIGLSDRQVCEVEVDPETGTVRIVAFAAVVALDRVIDPVLVEGRMQAAMVQGVGRALMESAMPRPSDLPVILIEVIEHPSCPDTLPEATPAAVMNAVVDALADGGVTHLDLPATPERVWRALREAEPCATTVPPP